jgi:2-hydroxy-6-oxonona-2,4-dienedioate hydrolase
MFVFPARAVRSYRILFVACAGLLVGFGSTFSLTRAGLGLPGEAQIRERLRLPADVEPAVVQAWVAKRTAQLNAGSQVIQTGPGQQVEYVMKGHGPIVLCLHGGFGGYDMSYLMGQHLVNRGFTVLAVSRPGYLRSTPLPPGSTPKDQADVMVALLDALGIDQVAVLGFSAGTGVGAEIAAHYPNRVWAMVLECVGSPPGDGIYYDILGQLLEADLIDDELPYLLYEVCRRYPRFVAEFVVASDTNLEGPLLAERLRFVQIVPSQLLFMRDFMYSITPLSTRRLGLIADVTSIDPWASIPLETMTVPTMFIEAYEDNNGYYPQALQLAARMIQGNARFVTVEDSGHFIWLGRYTYFWQSQLLRFLKEHSPSLSSQ